MINMLEEHVGCTYGMDIWEVNERLGRIKWEINGKSMGSPLEVNSRINWKAYRRAYGTSVGGQL